MRVWSTVCKRLIPVKCLSWDKTRVPAIRLGVKHRSKAADFSFSLGSAQLGLHGLCLFAGPEHGADLSLRLIEAGHRLRRHISIIRQQGSDDIDRTGTTMQHIGSFAIGFHTDEHVIGARFRGIIVGFCRPAKRYPQDPIGSENQKSNSGSGHGLAFGFFQERDEQKCEAVLRHKQADTDCVTHRSIINASASEQQSAECRIFVVPMASNISLFPYSRLTSMGL